MIREWLGANRVYFEVLSSVLFGIAATLISVASFNLSRNSYNLRRKQYRISAAGLEPHFVLEDICRDDDTIFGDSKWLVISNIGAPVYNLTIRTETFLQIRLTAPKRPKRIIYLPLAGFYDTTFRGSAHIGQVAEVSGYQNQKKFYRFHEQMLSAPNKKSGIYFRDLSTVAQIDYDNQMQEHGKEFFVNTARVSDDVARGILQWRERLIPTELDQLDLETVYSVLEKVDEQT